MSQPGILLRVLFLSLVVASLSFPPAAVGQAGQAAPPQLAAQGSAQALSPAGQPATAEKKGVKGFTLSPEKYQKAVEYARARYRLHFIDAAYGVLILLLVLAWRMAPKYRAWAERASSRRFVQAWIYVPLLLLSLGVLGLPTDVYGHWLSRKYDQSVQGWGSWAWDWAKGQLIAIIIFTFLVWILYGVIRRSARRWWFYFWLAALPVLVFVIFLSPLVIDPLFFKFEPLAPKQPQLAAAIEGVVQRGGLVIPKERMFEMKASEKLKSLNAYVTGIGASKRVVVWDTTIAKTTTPQTLFVFGHEMGHYVLGHIWKGISFFAFVLLVCLYLGFRTSHGLLARWGSRWGIRSLDDWASLPALLLLLSVFIFLAEPVVNTFSRHQEHQADIYGLEVIHGIVPDSAEVAGQAFQILGEVNLSDPNPSEIIRIWLYSHPPIAERIVFARTYDPWSKGQAPEFVK